MPLGFSSNASVKSAEIVFAGYGISSAELKYDDYAVSNAKGRVAIVFAGLSNNWQQMHFRPASFLMAIICPGTSFAASCGARRWNE